MELKKVLMELDELRNVPISDCDEIETPFLLWDKGTSRLDIWRFYEEECKEFSMGLYLEGYYKKGH